jgi:hypothetical protein
MWQRKLDEKIALRDKEIERMQKFIDGLDALYGDEDDVEPDREMLALMINKEPGITDAIRTVLFRKYPGWMTPMQVRDGLILLKLRLPETNPMASVHTILKRLKRRGEIEGAIRQGEVAYRWSPFEKRQTPKSKS